MFSLLTAQILVGGLKHPLLAYPLRWQNLVAVMIISQIGYNNILVIFLSVLSSDPQQIFGEGG